MREGRGRERSEGGSEGGSEGKEGRVGIVLYIPSGEGGERGKERGEREGERRLERCPFINIIYF